MSLGGIGGAGPHGIGWPDDGSAAEFGSEGELGSTGEVGGTGPAILATEAFENVAELRAIGSGEGSLGFGSRGPAVRAIQRALIVMGHDLGSGGADGMYGRGTERQVTLLQRNLGLTPTGKVDLETLHMIDEMLTQGSDSSSEPRSDTPVVDPMTGRAYDLPSSGSTTGYDAPDFMDASRHTIRWGSDPTAVDSGLRGALRMLDEHAGGITGTDTEFEQLAEWVGGAKEVGVAVLDDGVALDHPVLADNRFRARGEVPGDGVDNDGSGLPDDVSGWDHIGWKPASHGSDGWHGTAVAGIAAYGTDRVKIIGETALSTRAGDTTSPDLEAVVDHVRSLGGRVVNMSFTSGDAGDAESLRAAMRKHQDMLFVSAAGNDGLDVDSADVFPASLRAPNHIAVANVTRQGALFEAAEGSSSYGASAVHLGAVGTDIRTSADPRNDASAVCGPDAPEVGCYASQTGTSFSAPLVSNVAAKLMSLHPTLTATEAKRIILDTVKLEPTLRGRVSTGGVIDPQTAYRVAAVLQRRSQGEPLSAALATLPGQTSAADRAVITSTAQEILASRRR